MTPVIKIPYKEYDDMQLNNDDLDILTSFITRKLELYKTELSDRKRCGVFVNLQPYIEHIESTERLLSKVNALKGGYTI